ncbi:flagellar biosynthesis protein FlhA [Vibrio astriarenae]|nr:flagellar biosynthesis protein FlhA [Vibrio sp. C7]
MFVIGSVPNMPHLAFYTFAVLLAFAGWQQSRYRPLEADREEPQTTAPIPSEEMTIDWSVIPNVDVIGLTLGFKLVPLVSKTKGANLIKSIKGSRKNLSEQVGFVIPEIVITDDLALKPSEYVISIDGDDIEKARSTQTDLWLLVALSTTPS